MPTKSIRIIIAFLLVYVVWGSTYLAIRFAIETLPAFTMAGVRFFTAGGILLLYCYRQNIVGRINLHHWRNTALIGGFLLVGGNGAVVWAEHFVPSGLAALFIATVPWWMVILEWLILKETKPNKWTITGLLLGFLGVVVLVIPALKGSIHLGGALVLLMAAFWWAIGSIYSKKAILPSSALTTTALEMICGGLILLIIGFVHGEWNSISIDHVTSKSILALLYLIIFGSLVGFTAYIWLLGQVSPSLVSTYAFVNPMVAVFLGWLLASEQMSFQIILAAVFIIAAVLLITLGQKIKISEAP